MYKVKKLGILNNKIFSRKDFFICKGGKERREGTVITS